MTFAALLRPRWSATTRSARAGLVLLVLFIGAASAADRPLRVATVRFAPFVFTQTDPPTGFSVDLWNELARRMRVDFSWAVAGSEAEMLQAVQRGEADVAIAAIAMTPERDKLVDFSYPYFDSGLQIMVRAQSESSFATTFQAMPWLPIGQLFGAAIIIVFLLANLIWLIERRSNSDFAKPYLRAIGEGLWGTMLIIATGEHGNRNAPGALKRVVVVLMWLLGVVLIAQLTATVTSSQTVQRLQSSIQGPDDLPGKTIATLPGSVAAQYLTQRGLPFVAVSSGPDGIRMLAQGEAQAIVFDAPTLQYWATRQGKGIVNVVGPIFRPEKYAIVMAEGSPLRKSINKALLELFDDGGYDDIRARWFSRGK